MAILTDSGATGVNWADGVRVEPSLDFGIKGTAAKGAPFKHLRISAVANGWIVRVDDSDSGFLNDSETFVFNESVRLAEFVGCRAV